MRYIQLSGEDSLPKLQNLHPFKTGLLAELPVDHDRQFAVCEWLVAAGCVYVMVCGESPAGTNYRNESRLGFCGFVSPQNNSSEAQEGHHGDPDFMHSRFD